jgi:nucleoside-diphosphate-sugar epimerase
VNLRGKRVLIAGGAGLVGSRRLAPTEEAERMLGFTAQIPLKEGLRGLVHWWQSERAAVEAPLV